MKKIALLLLFTIMTLNLSAQMPQAATWTSSVEMTSAKEGVIIMKMTVNKGWHVYSTEVVEGGPKAMVFDLSASTGVQLIGDPTPSIKPTKKFDDMFQATLNYWSQNVVFKQKFKITNKKKAKIDGYVQFQACNDESCMPPKKITIAPTIPTYKATKK